MALKPLEPGLRAIIALASVSCFAGFMFVTLRGAEFGGSQIAIAAMLGATCLALSQASLSHQFPRRHEFLFDFFALAAIAAAHDAATNVWQVPAVWLDLLRLSTPGTICAALIYFAGTVSIQARQSRHLAWHVSLCLLSVPLLFNLVLALGADGLMQQLGYWATLHVVLPTPQTAAILAGIGRTLVLGGFVEFLVAGLGFSSTGRLPRDIRLHLLLWASSLHAVVSPKIAEIPQAFATGSLASMLSAPVAAAFAQAGLWSFIFIASGLTIEAVAGRPPVFASAQAQWRQGFVNGAIYGGLFAILALLWGGCLALLPLISVVHAEMPLLAALTGAAIFPFLATLIASADGVPPFFRRLWANYCDPRSYLRGLFLGLCVFIAVAADLQHEDGSMRFAFFFAAGALAYAGIDLLCDALAISLRRAPGSRRKLDTWRVYALGLGLGGMVGGALGWYFDAGQLGVVATKFRSYADLAYQISGRSPNEFVIYPLFSKWGVLDLGTVGGGIKLFFTESLSGVINWSLAAPLFSVNFVILAALFQKDLRPLKQLLSQQGLDGLVTQAVRVLRWGLWMAPVINTFLKMSPEPSWYNQDGAVRSITAVFSYAWLPAADFRLWSLVVFTGLLAYDWLRVLIWFDHMGLRVATLVNLTFVGGDKLDEAAARFAGHAGRSRFIPEALRRFATWAPLLIPFYIPRGADWDKAWSGAEQLHNAPIPPPVSELVIAYEVAALWTLAIVALVALHWPRSYASKKAFMSNVPRVLARRRTRFTLSNGLIGTEILSDGRGFTEVYETARGGAPIDLTRRPTDPLHLRGTFFYLRDKISGAYWSLGFEPVHKAGPNYRISEIRSGIVEICNQVAAIETKIEIWLDESAAVEFRRVSVCNRSAEPRRLSLTSYQELALNDLQVYFRDPDFNALHVETVFVESLNTLFARNRLLRDGGKSFTARRMSREVFFHAVSLPGVGAALEGYEDSRLRFRGDGDLRCPQGLEEGRARRPNDEGHLYSFDPAASLTVGIDVAAHGSCELLFISGHAREEETAARLICRCFGWAEPPPGVVRENFNKFRALEPQPGKRDGYDFGFVDEGRAFALTHQTPSPWAHVLGNPRGFGTILSNDGEIHSFAGNERQNAVTPFVWESGTASLTGQAIYIVDIKAGETFAASFAPLRRHDARYEVVYELGAATYRAYYAETDIEMTIFVPPDCSADVRLITLRNRAAEPRHFRILPYFHLALAENTLESLGRIEFAETRETGILRFRYLDNDFETGWGFAATSLKVHGKETVRARFIGASGRDLSDPCMVVTGAADVSVGDDDRRIAALLSFVEVAPQSEVEFSVVLGEAPTRAKASTLAKSLNTAAAARAALAATRQYWAETTPAIRIETNHPHFDHLVNHWLHYQILVSRLWARGGPNQRSGAFGFRDQLQDVLPLVFADARLARSQILLHASQQFREGDVLKWWHRAPNGRTGLGQRSRASDPHLWLPHVVARYVAATGDQSVLHERTAYLEGLPVPLDLDSITLVPRASRDDADLYEHCRLAIDYTLARMGVHGLPLIGTGDWNDGIDVVGFEGRGESVWLGFFLHEILTGFTPLIAAREAELAAEPYRDHARKLKTALDCAWRRDHYIIAFADDGRDLDRMNAMTAAWPILSGAVAFERGLAALEGPLERLEKSDRILLIDPPFSETADPYPGRIADYPPGVRENGAQYSHGASWAVDAYVRLADLATAQGDAEAAGRFKARAFTCWRKISPLGKTGADALATYGLAPIQQAADIYDGDGHAGRGGWSWYTGAAARMLSAAYEILGVRMQGGKISVAEDLFEPKGDLVVKRLHVHGEVFTAESTPAALNHA
jgi:cyclic beta-1,2-glucan synthetase